MTAPVGSTQARNKGATWTSTGILSIYFLKLVWHVAKTKPNFRPGNTVVMLSGQADPDFLIDILQGESPDVTRAGFTYFETELVLECCTVIAHSLAGTPKFDELQDYSPREVFRLARESYGKELPVESLGSSCMTCGADMAIFRCEERAVLRWQSPDAGTVTFVWRDNQWINVVARINYMAYKELSADDGQG